MRFPQNSLSDYPGKYRANDSPLHRLNPGLKLLISLGLTISALITKYIPLIAGLIILLPVLYFVSNLRWRDFWRDSRFFFFQTPVIILLYLLKYEPAYALSQGLMVACKILLAVVPAMLVQRTTSAGDMIQAFRMILPDKAAFILFTSLRFIPLLLRESQDIYNAQILRGARITPKHLLNPRNWKDFSLCFILPLMVRILTVTREVAISAQIRGIDTHNAHIERMTPSHTPQQKTSQKKESL